MTVFIKTEPITATQQFQTHDEPRCNMLRVLKWHQERLVKDSKPQEQQCSVRTPDNTERSHVVESIQVEKI
jgi:hypothetical protein